MAEVLEWFQCKRCGRRHRWAAEIAGKTVPCQCGAMVYCPEGVKLKEAAGAADTIIEDSESITAASPRVEGLELDDLTGAGSVAYGGPLVGAAKREAAKRFVVWSVMLLVAVAMVIHAITLWGHRHTLAIYWGYFGLAVLLTPISLFKFIHAKRRWQRGRKFMVALEQTFSGS